MPSFSSFWGSSAKATRAMARSSPTHVSNSATLASRTTVACWASPDSLAWAWRVWRTPSTRAASAASLAGVYPNRASRSPNPAFRLA